MNLELLKKRIVFYLSFLSKYIEGLNSIHYFDINTSSEDFFKTILNMIYGYELENINIIDMNTCAIDLGDKKNRIAIQVTSDGSSAKIKYTIQKFIEKKLYEQYDTLHVFVITQKQQSYTTKFDTCGKFNFNTRDIMDYKDIVKEINKKEDKELENIFKYIEQQFIIPYNMNHRNNSNEIDTIMNMISFISANKSIEPIEIAEDYEPDPEFKIETRFKEYSDILKETYKALCSIYGEMIQEIEKNLGLDRIRINLIKIFLKDISIKYLLKNGNNPLIALEDMVEYFEEELKKSNMNYDRMAIKGYLINQIIKCNVFPNEVKNEKFSFEG